MREEPPEVHARQRPSEVPAVEVGDIGVGEDRPGIRLSAHFDVRHSAESSPTTRRRAEQAAGPTCGSGDRNCWQDRTGATNRNRDALPQTSTT